MKQLKQTYVINAPVERVWRAFVDPKLIAQWGGGPAKMTDRVGPFSLWGGDIHGKNTKVVEHELIEQDWFSGNKWPSPSKLRFIFKPNGHKTIVELEHRNIPDQEAKDIEQGWREYYLGPVKQLFG